ncbi:MAG: IclR family transcriptional regulator [Acidobacteriota bacterium]
MPSNGQPHATSIERAFSILEMLDGARRGWNISEISRKQNIPKSSAHVIVLTLERLGYVKREPGSRRYKLGLKICSLGRGLMSDLALPELALPHMRWLVEQTRLTAHLGILERNHAVFIQKVDGPGMIKFDTYVGKRSPLHCTGLGKVLLAFNSNEDIIREILSAEPFAKFTQATITSAAGLRKDLALVRQRGFSTDDEEEELGVRCVAVPVVSKPGELLCALSVTGTTAQIVPENFEKLAEILKESASRISRALKTV